MLIALPIREMHFVIRTSDSWSLFPPPPMSRLQFPTPYSLSSSGNSNTVSSNLSCPSSPPCVICPSQILISLHALNSSYFVLSRMRTPFPMRHFTFRIAGHHRPWRGPLRRPHLSPHSPPVDTPSLLFFSFAPFHFASRLAKMWGCARESRRLDRLGLLLSPRYPYFISPHGTRQFTCYCARSRLPSPSLFSPNLAR